MAFKGDYYVSMKPALNNRRFWGYLKQVCEQSESLPYVYMCDIIQIPVL